MRRFSRSFLAAAVAAGLLGGVGCAQPGPAVVQVTRAHPHLHRALARLREARRELEHAEEIFRGHREEAIGYVDKAIQQAEEGLREQGDNVSSAELSPGNDLEGRFPHMHHALEHLREARAQLESADPIFGGHRDRAIEATDHAIRQVEEGIHVAER